MYVTSSSSLVFLLPTLHYMIVDDGYNAKKLYEYSKKTLGIDMVCPLYKGTKVLPKSVLRSYVFMNRHEVMLSIAEEEYLLNRH